MREQVIDLQDVQGVVRGYSASFPAGMFLLLTIEDAEKFRDFLKELMPEVATMGEWRPDERPDSVINIAFTHAGLRALGLPAALLGSFPVEFQQGMRQRNIVNSDIDLSDPAEWESCWQDDSVHVWIGVYAINEHELKERVDDVLQCQARWGSSSTAGQQPVHRLSPPDPNDVAPGGIYERFGFADVDYDKTRHLEHFGFVDGISDPAVEGLTQPGEYGGGKIDQHRPEAGWLPLAPGEFLLGHYKDEADQRPEGPASLELAANGTFMVYRKLEQNTTGFWDDMKSKADQLGIDATNLAEHMMGRRRNGDPLIEATEGKNDFVYADDDAGRQCPLGAHVRRANPRDSLGFGTVLVDRHRMLRRGIPYGEPFWKNPSETERGLIFIALNASISRQFEFVQRRWLNDGNVFFAGNNRDPIAGTEMLVGHFVLNAREKGTEPGSKERPMICPAIKSFVKTRGGEYFFLPGLGGLHYLAEGVYRI